MESPSKENIPASLNTYHPLVESFSKFAFILVGLCYGIGMIIVNMNLSQYGFYSLNLFRVNYILAGIWAFITLLWCYGLIFVIEKMIEKQFKPKITLLKIIPFVFSVSIYAWTIYYLAISFKINVSEIGWLNGCTTLFYGTLTVLVWSLTVEAFLKKRTKVLSDSGNPFQYQLDKYKFAISLVYRSVLIFVFLFNFGKYIYGHIPIEVGGGQPKQIVIIPKPNATNYLMLSGIEFQMLSLSSDSSSQKIAYSKPQKLLLANEKEYIILVSKDSLSYAASIDINLVEMILYTSKFNYNEPTKNNKSFADSLKN